MFRVVSFGVMERYEMYYIDQPRLASSQPIICVSIGCCDKDSNDSTCVAVDQFHL